MSTVPLSKLSYVLDKEEREILDLFRKSVKKYLPLFYNDFDLQWKLPFLLPMVFKLHNQGKGQFNNHVDKILIILDPLPPSRGQFHLIRLIK